MIRGFLREALKEKGFEKSHLDGTIVADPTVDFFEDV
jgi:hypothetical protein